jgi:hypothetical protein
MTMGWTNERSAGGRKEGDKGTEEWNNRDEKIVLTRIERNKGDMNDDKLNSVALVR